MRHPHADRLSESVCYQVFPNNEAALAWRYWDQRAVERTDGTRGRPLVSRVLVGQINVLSPEVAVALCRTGLLASLGGPMPGDVPDGGQLPTISGDAVGAITRGMVPKLDEAAARQAGLQAVIAAALADPYIPLTICVEDDLIQESPRDGVQCPLLWGLGRIAGPLLGAVGRGWSFSTFEPPLGALDPGSLPAIVFRQSQEGNQAPPARWRKEIRVHPLAPDALGAESRYADQIELAGRLVAEYQARGGDGLEQLIKECCGNERSLQVRLERVYGELRDTESPVIISPGPPMAVSLSEARPPAQERPQPEDAPAPVAALAPADTPAPADAAPAAAEAISIDFDDPEHHEYPAPSRGMFESPLKTDAWTMSLATSREGQTPPRLSLPDRSGPQPSAPEPDPPHSAETSHAPQQSSTVSYLLKQLELAGDDDAQFKSILRRIAQTGDQSDDPDDRARSWHVISNNDWYINICKRHAFSVQDLAEIFRVVVIPDLTGQVAAEGITRWACEAPPTMIGGLLAAARRASPGTWKDVMHILEPVLAVRWTADQMIQDQWDASRALRLAAGSGRGGNKRGAKRHFWPR